MCWRKMAMAVCIPTYSNVNSLGAKTFQSLFCGAHSFFKR